MKEQTKVNGWVEICHYDQDMNLIEKQSFKNLVVTTGLEWVASRCNDPVPPAMSWVAVGGSTDLPALNQIALVSEIVRVPVSPSGGAVSTTNIIYTATLGPGVGTGALAEAGLFNQAAGGTMLSRVTYPVINKGASDTVAVNWTITFG
jgi:hypothetical protein